MKLIIDIILVVAFIVALSIGTFLYAFSMVIAMELVKWWENRKSRKNK